MFAPGARLVLREWDATRAAAAGGPTGEYTGRCCRVRVIHVLRDAPYVPSGYAALSIRWEDAPDPPALSLALDATTAVRLQDWSRVLQCGPAEAVARALRALDCVLELASQGGRLPADDWRRWHHRITRGVD